MEFHAIVPTQSISEDQFELPLEVSSNLLLLRNRLRLVLITLDLDFRDNNFKNLYKVSEDLTSPVEQWILSIILTAKDELVNLHRYFSEKLQKLDIASEYVSSLEDMTDMTRQFNEDLTDLIEIVGTFEEIMMESSP